MKKITNGLLVILEGGEGVGKTTQAKALVDYYNSQGYSAKYFREPGGNKLAEDIRNLALYNEMDATTETLLMSAARNINAQINILPALRAGDIVILDRFTTSTLVYQGMFKNGDMDFITACNNKIAADVYRNSGYTVEFILSCDPKVAMERAASEGHERNKNDILPIEDYKKINDAYIEVFHITPVKSYNPDCSVMINTTNLSEKEVFEDILFHMDDIINSCKVYEE